MARLTREQLNEIREEQKQGPGPYAADCNYLDTIDALESELNVRNQIITQQNEERLKINAENQSNYNALSHELSALRETQKAREAAIIEKAAKEAYNVAAQCAYPADHDACDYFGCFDIQRVGDAIRALKPDSALDDLLREARRPLIDTIEELVGDGTSGEYESEYDGRTDTLCKGCDYQDVARPYHDKDCTYMKAAKMLAALRAPLEPEGK